MNRLRVCFLLVTAFLIFGCSSGVENKHTDISVTVLAKKIERESVERVISLSGNIEGFKTAKLGFMVSGKVNYIAVKEGAAVEEGQLLASLDPENYKIAKEIADASLDQIQDEYNRISIMHERKSISDGDFSKISNTLKLARAQQKLQIKNLSDTKLYSPFRGVLLKRGTEVGETVGSGHPLFAVSDIHIVKVNAAVPETDLRLIKIGGMADVFVSSVNATFSGRVVEIGSVAEPATRSFSVKIELQNPNLIIRPGMTAEIKILSGQKSNIIAVPGDAVLREPDNSAYVFVADPVGMKAFKRKVALGRMTGSNVEVTSGILPNDLVIVGGQHNLINGSLITLKQQI